MTGPGAGRVWLSVRVHEEVHRPLVCHENHEPKAGENEAGRRPVLERARDSGPLELPLHRVFEVRFCLQAGAVFGHGLDVGGRLELLALQKKALQLRRDSVPRGPHLPRHSPHAQAQHRLSRLEGNGLFQDERC